VVLLFGREYAGAIRDEERIVRIGDAACVANRKLRDRRILASKGRLANDNTSGLSVRELLCA
jgi:hypothetical protein